MLEVHRAERADVLAAALCAQLSMGTGDPFEAEIIAVPSRGVERWLTQQLSLVLGARAGLADGVCANVEFPGPARLVADVVAAVSGIEPRTDPWRPGRSSWPLLELIDGEPGLLDIGGEPVPSSGVPAGVSESAGGPKHARQYAAARHLAALFDAYATFRPRMITDWAAGSDTDGAGEQLAPDLVWQARLWRRLRALLAVASPAERLDPACRQLIGSPELVELPRRLSLFGLTRLPPGQLEVLAALAAHREVHLWLLHPSPVLWDRVRVTAPSGPVRRRADASGTARLARQPLLASLGRDARELQLTLSAVDPQLVTDSHAAVPEGPPAHALQVLQQAIRADTEPAGQVPVLLHPSDHSLQIHACHGRARQVEVLRDVVLGLLAADASLEPRDVLVMCPDIETFAPLISATFGVGSGAVTVDAADPERPESPAAQLRVRLADRSLRQTNPVMSVAATVLEMADGRMTASEVLDLAAAPPVRRRFGFDDDDLGRLTDWVTKAQVRWGLDAHHRSAFQLGDYPQNTWEAGLDRLLLGVTMAEGPAGGLVGTQPGGPGWLGLALPLDDVDSTDIELVGLLAELVHRLRDAAVRLAGPQSLTGWIAALETVVEGLTATGPSESWQAAQLRGEFAAVLDGAGERAGSVQLSLADIRHVLGDRLQGRPTRANFRTGSLTVCTLVPMRSVPHRVVCLLGLDDGEFPRRAAVDVDDVLRRAPLTGERDERSEDRQLFLDAISSAGDHLVVIYSGADERTNARRPPAVPVGELLDVLDETFIAVAPADAARDQFVVRHPLQPFDPANFVPRSPGVPPFSFDRAALGGAWAVTRPRTPAEPFLTDRLPAVAGADLELDTLRQFLEAPVRGFLRQRLEVTLPDRDEETNDALSLGLDSLQRWGVGNRMLQSRLAGVDPSTCRQAEWRRGTLPPRELGTRILDEVAADVEEIVAAAHAARSGTAATIDLSIPLADGRRLTGTVGGVHGTSLVTVDFGKINAKRRLRAWLPYLLLVAARPDTEFDAVAIGRRSRCQLGPVGADEARAWLNDLARLHAAGLREPLPIAVETSFAYAGARRKNAVVEEALRRAGSRWNGWDFPGEQSEPAHERVFGPRASFDVLTADPAEPGDGAADWPDEPSRFGVLSRRWWDPLLDAEARGMG